jgi:hypothetical protein
VRISWRPHHLLFRVSVSGDRDREREEGARKYFEEYGVWPDDDERARMSQGASGRSRAAR